MTEVWTGGSPKPILFTPLAENPLHQNSYLHPRGGKYHATLELAIHFPSTSSSDTQSHVQQSPPPPLHSSIKEKNQEQQNSNPYQVITGKTYPTKSFSHTVHWATPISQSIIIPSREMELSTSLHLDEESFLKSTTVPQPPSAPIITAIPTIVAFSQPPPSKIPPEWHRMAHNNLRHLIKKNNGTNKDVYMQDMPSLSPLDKGKRRDFGNDVMTTTEGRSLVEETCDETHLVESIGTSEQVNIDGSGTSSGKSAVADSRANKFPIDEAQPDKEKEKEIEGGRVRRSCTIVEDREVPPEESTYDASSENGIVDITHLAANLHLLDSYRKTTAQAVRASSADSETFKSTQKSKSTDIEFPSIEQPSNLPASISTSFEHDAPKAPYLALPPHSLLSSQGSSSKTEPRKSRRTLKQEWEPHVGAIEGPGSHSESVGGIVQDMTVENSCAAVMTKAGFQNMIVRQSLKSPVIPQKMDMEIDVDEISLNHEEQDDKHTINSCPSESPISPFSSSSPELTIPRYVIGQKRKREIDPYHVVVSSKAPKRLKPTAAGPSKKPARPLPRVTKLTAIHWSNELSRYYYLFNEFKETENTQAELDALLDKIERQDSELSKEWVVESKLGIELKKFRHKGGYSKATRKRAIEMWEKWKKKWV